MCQRDKADTGDTVDTQQTRAVTENAPITKADSNQLEADIVNVGDRVTHADPNHYRASMSGVIETVIDNGECQVWWEEDGDNQRQEAHRTYPMSDLKRI